MAMTRTFMLKQIAPSLTSLTGVGSVHLGGSFPASINNMITIPRSLRHAPYVMLYFAAVRPEHEYDDGASTELGQLAILKLYRHRKDKDVLKKEIAEIISLVNVLRACHAKYGFLDEFLYHIVRNKMKIGAAQTEFIVDAPLATLAASSAACRCACCLAVVSSSCSTAVLTSVCRCTLSVL